MKLNYQLAAACAAASLSLAACSGSGTNPIAPTQANLNANVLKLAVGTANIYGDLGVAGSSTGLNVVATYRQPAGAFHPGDSAVLVSTPTLSGPFTLPATASTTGAPFDANSTILTGPSQSEAGGSAMTGTPQNTTSLTTFGTSGGLFALGIEPFNYGDGSPATNVPYPVPLYDPIASDANSFVAWGGPPAFDLAGNGQSVVGSGTEPAGQAGISEGLDVFAGLAPVVGTYTLAANVPSNVANPTYKTTATLSSTAFLPPILPAMATADGNGGGTFTVTLPPGVTEAYIEVTDLGSGAGTGNCNGVDAGGALIYYTLYATATGTYGLGDAAGPGGTPSLCTAAQNATATKGATPTGDLFTVQSIGFDYPLYENSPSSSKVALNPSPTLTGANGQADVTVSSAVVETQTAGGLTPTPASRARLHGPSMLFKRHR